MIRPGHAGATGRADGQPTRFVRSAAHGLQFAAAPAFAIMALLTAVAGGGAPDILCAAAQHTSALTGMIPMYLLMSVFHAAPWLRLLSR